MKVVVCVKQNADGELNPFDACAYEMALRIPQAEVILLSMGPPKVGDMLRSLTRLGAKKAYLLCDNEFAGADTLATAYTLMLAIRKIGAGLVICGRQTMDGDTAQTGPELSAMLGYFLLTNVVELTDTGEGFLVRTREGETQEVSLPALFTAERSDRLRLPGLSAKAGEVIVWDARDLGAEASRCGQRGSPTRVVETFRNEEGKRHCRFIEASRLDEVIAAGVGKERDRVFTNAASGTKLKQVWIVGEAPRQMAETIGEEIRVIALQADMPEAAGRRSTAGVTCDVRGNENDTNFLSEFVQIVRREKPAVILWGSDPWSKKMAAQAAALLRTGLCADCTTLETDGKTLYMYRPAFLGNVIAKIVCCTRPQMATVRTCSGERADVMLSLGRGAADAIAAARAYRERKQGRNLYSWEMGASRGLVDDGLAPWEMQVGLTGRSVSPAVYLAVGISGAVHHIAGMKGAGTVIAVNPDKRAPVFDYADYGIVATAQEFFRQSL